MVDKLLITYKLLKVLLFHPSPSLQIEKQEQTFFVLLPVALFRIKVHILQEIC